MDRGNNRILKISADGRSVELFAGAGKGNYLDLACARNTGLIDPAGIAVSPDGQSLFVNDSGNGRVLRMSVDGGSVELIAGPVPAHQNIQVNPLKLGLSWPSGITVAPNGRTIFIVDSQNNRVLSVEIDRQQQIIPPTPNQKPQQQFDLPPPPGHSQFHTTPPSDSQRSRDNQQKTNQSAKRLKASPSNKIYLPKPKLQVKRTGKKIAIKATNKPRNCFLVITTRIRGKQRTIKRTRRSTTTIQIKRKIRLTFHYQTKSHRSPKRTIA